MHQCPICPKSFPSAYKLKRHHVVHTGQKPFVCKMCGKACTQSGHLKTHMQKVHRMKEDSLGNDRAFARPTHDRSAACVSTPDPRGFTVEGRMIQPQIKPTDNVCLTDGLMIDTSVPPETNQSNSSNVNPDTYKYCIKPPTGTSPLPVLISPSKLEDDIYSNSSLNTASTCSVPPSIKQESHSSQISGFPLRQQLPCSLDSPGNSTMELELQCRISVKDLCKSDVVKSEEDLSSDTHHPSNCHMSNEEEQKCKTRKDLKPFRCLICNRSFHIKVNLIRHHKTHRSQRESRSLVSLRSATSNVTVSISEAMKHSSEPSRADLTRLHVVKSEAQSESCWDYKNAIVKDEQITASAGHQSEAQQAAGAQQRIRKLHQCHLCLKYFPCASKLERHVMTHTGQRPFGCVICGKRFRQKTHLRVHSRIHVWSRYHKQRSLYINRPLSRIGALKEKSAQNADFENRKQGTSLPRAPFDHRKEPENAFLQHTLKRTDVEHSASKVTVANGQIGKSVRTPGRVQHKCFHCFKCFPCASKLQRHEMVHTGLKPFQCLACGKAFRQTSHLQSHKRTHYETKPSLAAHQQGKCRKLNQQGPYPKIRVHIPSQKPYGNTDIVRLNCGAVHNRANELLCTRRQISNTKTTTKSIVTHNKRNPHMCQICFKSFPTPYKLSRHVNTHAGIRPYKCSLCGKTFSQRCHLKVHQLRCKGAENVKNLQDKGNDRNTAPESRSQNLESSSGLAVEKPCDDRVAYCYTADDFTVRSEAVDNEWLTLPDVGVSEKNYECEEKQRDQNQGADSYSSFPSQLAFEIHKLVKNQNMAGPSFSQQGHGAEIPSQPGGTSNSYQALSSVVESQIHAGSPSDDWCEPLRAFECGKCSVGFQSENDLLQHDCNAVGQPQIRQSTPNSCDICLKSFASPSKLKRHYLVHTGQRPFRCDICGKRFTQSTHMKIHRQIHLL